MTATTETLPGSLRCPWHPWALDTGRGVVHTETPTGVYEVDLHWFRGPEHVVHALLTVADEAWSDKQTVVGLLRILTDTLNAPLVLECNYHVPALHEWLHDALDAYHLDQRIPIPTPRKEHDR